MKKNASKVRLAAITILIVVSFQSPAQYRNIDSLQTLVKRPDDSLKLVILNNISSGFRTINLDSSILYAKRAVLLADKINLKYGKFAGLENQIHAYTMRGEYAKCLAVDKECVSVAEAIGDKKLIALARGRLGITYVQLHHEARGFEEISYASSLYEKIGDKLDLGYFYVNLGNTYAINNDIPTARKYYRKAIEAAGNEASIQHVVNINLAEALQKEKKYDESFDYLDPALRYYEYNNDENTIAYILKLKGIAFKNLGNALMANKCFQSALKIYDRGENIDNQIICLTELADLSLSQKQLDAAKGYLDNAALLTTDPKKFLQLSRINKGYSEYYAATGDFREALTRQLQASALRDSFNIISQRRQLNDLQVQYEVAQAERKLEELATQKSTKNLIIILLVLLMVATGIIVFQLFKRQLARLIMSEEGKKQLEQELQTKDETEQRLKSEIEFKLKELTSFTLNMIQKKEMLEKIKSEIELVKEKTEGENRSHLTRIISTINFSQHLDKDWENFKLYFEQVNQGFFDNLQAHYPDLNSNDLKLCALIKLNLDTKQIASVMDISPESAKVAKHRIRKKLGLTGADNLTMFFATISKAGKENGLSMPPRKTGDPEK